MVRFHLGEKRSSPDIVQLLIDNDADVNAKALRSWTPLHYAARNGNLPIAQLLIAEGADVDILSLRLARDNPAMRRLLEDNFGNIIGAAAKAQE